MGDSHLVVVSLPKSGTVYFQRSLELTLPVIHRRVGTIDTSFKIDEAALDKFMNERQALVADHLLPIERNLELLDSAGIKRIALMVRDPRDAMVSWWHHLKREDIRERLDESFRLNDDNFKFDFDNNYFNMTEYKQLAWLIDHWYPFLQKWLADWARIVDRQTHFSFHVSRYEDFVGDPAKALRRMLLFFGYRDEPVLPETADDNRKYPAGIDAYTHFRRGIIGSHRDEIPSRLLSRLNSLTDQDLFKWYGWDVALDSVDAQDHFFAPKINSGRFRSASLREAILVERDRELIEQREALAEHETTLADRDREMAAHRTNLAARERELSEHRAALADRDATLAERDRELAEHRTALAVRETALAERGRELLEHRVALDKLHGALIERETEVAEHRAALAGRDAALAEYQAAVGELQTALVEHDTVREQERTEDRAALAERDAKLANRDQTIAAYGVLAAQRDATIAERDSELAEHRGALVERDAVIAEYRTIAAQRDATIAERDSELGEHRTALAHREAQLADRDIELAEHRRALAEREGALVERSRELAERSGTLAERERELAELQGELADRTRALAESHATLAARDRALEEHEQRLTSLYRSYSWRVTAPIRGMRRLLIGGT